MEQYPVVWHARAFAVGNQVLIEDLSVMFWPTQQGTVGDVVFKVFMADGAVAEDVARIMASICEHHETATWVLEHPQTSKIVTCHGTITRCLPLDTTGFPIILTIDMRLTLTPKTP